MFASEILDKIRMIGLGYMALVRRKNSASNGNSRKKIIST